MNLESLRWQSQQHSGSHVIQPASLPHNLRDLWHRGSDYSVVYARYAVGCGIIGGFRT